jgi:hypothetical protein
VCIYNQHLAKLRTKMKREGKSGRLVAPLRSVNASTSVDGIPPFRFYNYPLRIPGSTTSMGTNHLRLPTWCLQAPRSYNPVRRGLLPWTQPCFPPSTRLGIMPWTRPSIMPRTRLSLGSLCGPSPPPCSQYTPLFPSASGASMYAF